MKLSILMPVYNEEVRVADAVKQALDVDYPTETERGILLTRFSGGNPSDNLDFSGIAKNATTSQCKYAFMFRAPRRLVRGTDVRRFLAFGWEATSERS